MGLVLSQTPGGEAWRPEGLRARRPHLAPVGTPCSCTGFGCGCEAPPNPRREAPPTPNLRSPRLPGLGGARPIGTCSPARSVLR